MNAEQRVYFRRRVRAALIALVLVPVGIGWRMIPMPWLPHKYGGSFLWAVMVYWVVAALAPKLRPLYVLLLAAVIALGVEYSRLWHVGWLDNFRETMAGKLVLGKYFNLRNVVVYWAGILAAAVVDRVQFWPEVLEARRRANSGRG